MSPPGGAPFANAAPMQADAGHAQQTAIRIILLMRGRTTGRKQRAGAGAEYLACPSPATSYKPASPHVVASIQGNSSKAMRCKTGSIFFSGRGSTLPGA
mmetsp:Transcript_75907/g.210703  ORF Transcript_75907/g.210703 Transcript_75907/m.210703 type:complete len:99 (-) Transcript_75907:36-332(-)